MKAKFVANALMGMCLAACAADGVSFNSTTGAMTVKQHGEVLWQSGEHGLWRIRFRKGTFLSAADFATNGVAGGSFKYEHGAEPRLVWRSPEADVVVKVTPSADGSVTDFRAEVTPKRDESLMLDMPAHLTFQAATVKDFVYPGKGNSGPGLAFNSQFFMPATPDKPHGWTNVVKGGDGYKYLYGGFVKMQPEDSEPVQLQVTDEGKKWFRTTAVRKLNGWKRPVLRPAASNQNDFVLIDSPVGPYLAAKQFGGTGALWRFGVADAAHSHTWAPPAETYAISHLLPRIAERAPARKKVALIALSCGPSHGGFVRAGINDWRNALKKFLPPGCTYEELATIPAINRATTGNDYLFILNPYGEFFPVESVAGYRAALDRMRNFVKAGGNWVECGGYSFYVALHCGKYLQMTEKYPPLFADFAQLTTTTGGSVALYGVQPRGAHEPWKNPVHFVPGETGVGGSDAGGWFFHSFAAYAKPGKSVTTPCVRMRVGATLDGAIADYAQANTLTKMLDEKITRPGALDKFKRAPLLHVHGKASDMKKLLDAMPVPSLYHPSDYLKGGFDKEYPDHLPPNSWFGTAEELADLFRFAREKGHLVSPYTNPTWWCDHPRGPSFIEAGEAPLSVGLNGKPYHEMYAKNDGWTTTMWHPDVQKANRKTVREFTQDYPVDMLFQDQCGARTWRWDFNAASPSPTAYSEGIISMNEEDSRIVPIGTEDGWDHVANQQAALCGCSWRVVPLKNLPPWRDQFKDVYPAHTWRMEPVTQRLFHDKTLFYMHDLGAFVRDDMTLAWMFALGYNLSLNGGPDLEHFKMREWYEWLHVLQSKVICRIAGAPLKEYYHDRAPFLARTDLASYSDHCDDGVVTAKWGDVSVCVNLGNVPREVKGRKLAPYGWWIEGVNMRAGALEGEWAFVEAEGKRWEFAPDARWKAVRPTESQRTQPPCARADAPRTIGVLDFGTGASGHWVACSSGDWHDALAKSALVMKHGLKLVRLTTVEDVSAALKANDKFFAIVNPYGELYPCDGEWRDMLDAIRGFTSRGGHWVEVGGASFFVAANRREKGNFKSTVCGADAARHLGIEIGMDDIDEAPLALHMTAKSREWLPQEVQKLVEGGMSPVNRGLVAGDDTPVTSIIEDSAGRVWFGFHQLGGWGALWRLGGARPNPVIALKVVPAALEHAFMTPPPPVVETTRLRCVMTEHQNSL